jgi:hypothetical protein
MGGRHDGFRPVVEGATILGRHASISAMTVVGSGSAKSLISSMWPRAWPRTWTGSSSWSVSAWNAVTHLLDRRRRERLVDQPRRPGVVGRVLAEHVALQRFEQLAEPRLSGELGRRQGVGLVS